MKGRKGQEQPHVVVLSDRMIEIVEEARATVSKNGWLFPIPNKPTQPISNATFSAYLHHHKFKGELRH
jgi:hypothetical protein